MGFRGPNLTVAAASPDLLSLALATVTRRPARNLILPAKCRDGVLGSKSVREFRRFTATERHRMRLLLVEDDLILGSSLKKALEKHAYGVDWMKDGEAAIAGLEDLVFDVVVLDVNLPGVNGIEVLRSARKNRNAVPILLLTARDTSLQKVEGLDNGADDYLVKPFDLDELLARLRALMRRREGRTEIILKSGPIEMDPAAMVVRGAEGQIAMTAKEFRLLKLLMERAGKYVTKSDIEYALYSADSAVESNTTEVIIYNLRRKLGADFIRSIRGVGYMIES
ncbi:transcriptional regulator [Mesorhizobium sp. LNHC252B00]|nr:transcriptional regulator [Mesorhizobium sp. LNHC252B00]